MSAGKLFPDRSTWDETGLVAISREISWQMLREAYRKGIFPWPSDELEVTPWFSPDPRGVLDFEDLHVSKSLRKMLRLSPFRITRNEAFGKVVRECAKIPRRDQSGTWITEAMIDAYVNLFFEGGAFSVEAWEGNLLVGGIYGVLSENYFSAESMFYLRSNASKICFLTLIDELRARGHTWMDTQMVTEVTSAFGARLIPRVEFLKRIEKVPGMGAGTF